MRQKNNLQHKDDLYIKTIINFIIYKLKFNFVQINDRKKSFFTYEFLHLVQ